MDSTTVGAGHRGGDGATTLRWARRAVTAVLAGALLASMLLLAAGPARA